MDFQLMFAGGPAAMVVLDPELVILAVSDAYLAVVGTTRESIVGRQIFEVFPDDPDDAEASGVANVRASFTRVREHCVADVMPIQRYPVAEAGNGGDEFRIRYWAIVNTPIFGPGGELAWIIHRTDDVTGYVQEKVGDVSQDQLAAQLRPTARVESEVFARQRLQEQNQTLTAVLDSLDTAVVGCDRDKRAVLTNRAARELFGLPEHTEPVEGWARSSGFSFSDTAGNVIAPDGLPIELLLRGEHVHNMSIVAKADGVAARTLRVHGQRVVDGGRLAAVVAFHEITRQRRAERLSECERLVSRVLAKSEPADHVIANAVELIGDMLGWAAAEFWTVDEIGQVLRRKASWAVPGHHGLSDLPDWLEKGCGIPGASWADADPIWTTDLTTDISAAQQTADWRPLRAALAVPVPNGALVLGVLVCYSDNLETPDDMRTAVMAGIAAHLGEFLERRRAEQLAAELEATRDEYIALVGHELRTPLTTVQSYTDLMRSEPDLSGEDRQQMLDVMHRRVGDLHKLIAKLLDVAGTRSGHITLQSRRFDLAATVEDAAEHARNYHQPVSVDVNTPPCVMIDGDPDRLRDVVDEMLRNAITWAPADSTVGVGVHADDHTTVIAVSNTGARIPAEEHARVFDLFYRTRGSLTKGVPGSGLGLTLARAVVEQHGGTIIVSEPDEAATTFTIRLPTSHRAPADPRRIAHPG